MEERVKFVVPRYRQVAVDIASKIVDGQYQVGEKIYARSQVASQYAVSAETARRAIALLAETGIVEATKGSGVMIQSYENALLFLRRSQDANTLSELKKNAISQTEQLSAQVMQLKKTVTELVDRTDQFRFSNPFVPFRTVIQNRSNCIGKSLQDLSFWHNTAATVIAVRRGEDLYLSPGPYEVLQENDILYFIGEEACCDRVSALISEEITYDLL